MKKLRVVGITGALAGALTFTAFAQTPSLPGEVATARAHATMAQNSKTLTMAHTHLRHVVNCLVGPKGEGFDAAAGNPCKGQGNGALADSTADQALHGTLQHALATAQSGIKANSLATVQSDAGKIAAALQGAPSQ